MAAIWLTQQDLEAATSMATVLACFDGQNVNQVDPNALAQIIDRAEQEVLSWIVGEYGPPPLTAATLAALGADTFLKYAAVDYAVGFMFDRHPEAFRASKTYDVENRIKRADARMTRVLDARQRPPTVVQKPANVGGVSVDRGNRIVTDSADGTYNGGDY